MELNRESNDVRVTGARADGIATALTGIEARAAIITAPGKVQLSRIKVPNPKAGQVRVRVEGCGVCASNLPVWQGQPWFQYPFEPGTPGHEAWGFVESVGPNVSEVEVGDRVSMLSAHGYAEYDVARADEVIQLPPSMNNRPFPGEPLGCAMNIFRRAAIVADQTVAIVGTGFLGILLTALASASGARVIAISRRPFALEIAGQFGAARTIQFDSDHSRTVRDVMDITHGRGCDCVIEAVGKQQALDLATELTRESGRLVIAGYHQDGPRQVNMQLWNWRALELVNAHERDRRINVEGMAQAVGAIQSGLLNPYPLYTHLFGLEELPEAFAAAVQRPNGFLKALIII
jgi:2-desacetyl-2-hydroxyethyl bacteriochlorophyllide A dehydrogenase